MKYITRIAPSPTGFLHIGTARTCYFNYLAARSSGGKFILRIDDTDKTRSKHEYTEIIIETMKWLNLDYDEIHYQSKRCDRYNSVGDDWISKGLAYKEDGAVKFKLPTENLLLNKWRDEIAGEIKISDDDLKKMDGMVLVKTDGSPSYNFASIIDDYDMRVNYIIRGTDHISNCSKQIILWNLLDKNYNPKFAHIGLIGEKGKLLSKREGAASVLYYREKGYDADAFLNFLARLGWGPKVDDKSTSVLPKDKMMELFLTGGNLRSNIANIDLAKLEAYDRKYKAKKGIWRNAEKLI